MAKRDPSPLIECPKCGKQVRARGMLGHLRLSHNTTNYLGEANTPHRRKKAVKTPVKAPSNNTADLLVIAGLAIYYINQWVKLQKRAKALSENPRNLKRTA